MKEKKLTIKFLMLISILLMGIAVGIAIGNELSKYYAILTTIILLSTGAGISFILSVCLVFTEIRDLIKINNKLKEKNH